MNEFKESMKKENYGFTQRDVDKYMKKSKEELMKVPMEILNEICQACGGICNGNFNYCRIGAVMHERDKDEVDIFGEAKYNQYIPER